MPALSTIIPSCSAFVTSPTSDSRSPVLPAGGAHFHRSPISSSGESPLDVGTIHDETQTTAGVCPFAFIAPTESDSRGPCPALNTLANHGYLPRNGRNITRAQLLAALQNPDTYHVSKPLAMVLVYGGFIIMRRVNEHTLSLSDLSEHGLIEHNASLVHDDTASGHKFAPTRCDTKLLDKLLDSQALNLEKVARRREKLERADPLDLLHQEIARGEWALVLDIFGRENGGNCPSDLLRVWLKQNQFPEGWKPSHEQGLLATVSEAGTIRNEMKKCRKMAQPVAAPN